MGDEIQSYNIPNLKIYSKSNFFFIIYLLVFFLSPEKLSRPWNFLISRRVKMGLVMSFSFQTMAGFIFVWSRFLLNSS